MSFHGDNKYSITATGDAVVGDEVRFERAVFGGSFRNPKFLGHETVTGEIVAESYGSAKGQHTFTLRLADGSKTMIKGRNLYREGLWRKPWADEAARRAALAEKHTRGDASRAFHAARKAEFVR